MEQVDQIEEVEQPIDGVEPEGELPEVEAPEQEEEPDEVVVSIAGESPPQTEEEFQGQPAPEWVKELRKTSREQAKKIRELEAEKLTAARPAEAEVLGPEPTLEENDYDEAKFKAKWKTWNAKQAEQESKTREKQQQAKQEQDAWNAKLAAYREAPLRVPDFEDAEHATTEALNPTQQGILIIGPDSPAVSKQLIYALGKNPNKLKELSAIKDPVKFAFAAAKVLEKLTVTPRKTPPAPETPVRGSAPVSGAIDSQLAKLEAQAEKTGDRSAVTAYRKKLREKRAG
jgi:hypothetical protein